MLKIAMGTVRYRCAHSSDVNPHVINLRQDLTLNDGDMLVVQGENGTGKSTVLAHIANIAPHTRVTHGLHVTAGGQNSPLHPLSTMEVAYLAAEPTLIPGLTPIDYLCLAMWSHPKPARLVRAHNSLERFGLKHVNRKDVELLSSGQRKRLGLARTWVQARPVVVLDEPRSHLDDQARAMVDALLAEIRARKAIVIVASHDSADAHKATQIVNLRIMDEPHSVICDLQGPAQNERVDS